MSDDAVPPSSPPPPPPGARPSSSSPPPAPPRSSADSGAPPPPPRSSADSGPPPPPPGARPSSSSPPPAPPRSSADSGPPPPPPPSSSADSGPPPPPPPGAASSTAPPPPPAAVRAPSARGEPIEVGCDYPEHIANWRPLVHWLLVIPQVLIAVALTYAAMILSIVAFFTVLFTCNVPVGMHNFMVMTLRYSWRVNTYSYWMRESYPPFDFATVAAPDDPAIEPDSATLGIERPTELNRWLPLVKWLLAIPHYFYAIAIGILAFALLVAAWFAVLFTGRYPRSIFDLLVGIQWWGARLSAYLFFLRDEYPSFRLGR